jgi:hypothetical protein
MHKKRDITVNCNVSFMEVMGSLPVESIVLSPSRTRSRLKRRPVVLRSPVRADVSIAQMIAIYVRSRIWELMIEPQKL